MTHWTDLAIEVAALRKKKRKLPLHPKLPNAKVGKLPKAGLPKPPAKKKINGITVSMPQPPQDVFQKNSARGSFTPAEVREMRRSYAGAREDRVFSGTLRVVRKR